MLTAAEARVRGDATDEQRTELRELIKSKAIPDNWVRRFYEDVRTAGGLSRGRANGALIYLRALPDKAEQPTYATPEQGDELRSLIRVRIVPSAMATLWTTRLDAGELTYVEAERALTDLRRLPQRSFVAPDGVRHTGTRIPDGYYALTATDGTARCYRIHSGPIGDRRVDQITGDRASQRRRLRGHQAKQIMTEVGADIRSAARLYGKTRKRCSECNKALRDKDQPGYPHGYGPDCWAALQETEAGTTQTALPTDPTPTEGAQ